MTLIVVDADRMTADSYATVVRQGVTKHTEGFPKLFTLNKPLALGSHVTYPCVAFTGDAHTFYWFLMVLTQLGKLEGTAVIDIDEVLPVLHNPHVNPMQVIAPAPGGVVVITTALNTPPAVEFRAGSKHGFGSAYTPPSDVPTEHRSWKEIFHSAQAADSLPGGDVHYMTYRADHALPPTRDRLDPISPPDQPTVWAKLKKVWIETKLRSI